MLYLEETECLSDPLLGILRHFVLSIVRQVERIQSDLSRRRLNVRRSDDWGGPRVRRIRGRGWEKLTRSDARVHLEEHLRVVEVEVDAREVSVRLVGVPDDTLEPVSSFELGVARRERVQERRFSSEGEVTVSKGYRGEEEEGLTAPCVPR